MSRPITLCTAQWADLPLEEICKVAKQMGYEGLELATWGPIDAVRAAEDLEYVKEIKDTLAKYGLGCWALATHVPGQCVADPGRRCRDGLYGFSGLEIFLFVPADARRNGGRRVQGSRGKVDAHFRRV